MFRLKCTVLNIVSEITRPNLRKGKLLMSTSNNHGIRSPHPSVPSPQTKLSKARASKEINTLSNAPPATDEIEPERIFLMLSDLLKVCIETTVDGLSSWH